MTAYTLWGQTGGGTVAADTSALTIATQFTSVRPTMLTGIWFYSPSGAGSLPSACAIYDLRTQVQLAVNSSPSWSGAAGSGWVKCTFPGTLMLGWAGYIVAVAGGGGATNWYASTSGYWTTGGAAPGGIASGPLSAGTARHTSQGLKHAGAGLAYPGTDGAAVNFWVDVEVTDITGLPVTYNFMPVLTLPPDPSLSDSTSAVTFGTQFAVSKTCRADAIWQLNSGIFPTTVGIFKITGTGTGTLMCSVASPAVVGPGIYSWSRIPIPSVTLQPGTNYEVCSYRGDGAQWMPFTSGYWTSGTGASGLSGGIISAPNNATAVNGQSSTSSTNAFTFPDTAGSGDEGFADVEVIPVSYASPLVQSMSATANGTSITVTLQAPTTPGSCLVVCLSGAGGASGSAITSATLGGAADHFGSVVSVGNLATDAGFVSIWADPNCVGGQTSVVLTTDAGSSRALCAWVYEFSFLNPTIATLADKTATLDSGAGQTTAPSIGPTSTTTQANEIWVSALLGYNTTITGPGLPWRNQNQITLTNNSLMAGYQVVASTGTATYASTFGTNTYAIGAVATLKMSGAGLLMASFP